MRRIYLASSWKNAAIVRDLALLFREFGHEVFDFTDPDHRPDGLDHFIFPASEWMGKPLNEIKWLEFMECPATMRAFNADRAGLDWADTVVLILPCGRSAHLEAGYAAGKGKDLFIWGELPPGEFETMYGLARGRYALEQLPILTKDLMMSQNTQEGRQGMTQKVMGIDYSKWAKKWRATLTINGQRTHLGYFDTKAGAISARRTAEDIYGIPTRGPNKAKSRILVDREIAFVEIHQKDKSDTWAIIDSEDSRKVEDIRWRVRSKYVYSKIGWLHRIVMGARDSPLDSDHINHDIFNNRKQNLRLCTHGQNLRNQKVSAHYISGVIGVHYENNRWIALINVEKKRLYLGSFKTKEEAVRERKRAEEFHALPSSFSDVINKGLTRVNYDILEG